LLIPASQISKLQWSDNGQPLSEFPLTSPIAGTLARRDLSIGAMIDRNRAASLMMINPERVWVLTLESDAELTISLTTLSCTVPL
jgi:hypothetical protein